MPSPPATPNQDRAGNTRSGVSFSPTGRASKVDDRAARVDGKPQNNKDHNDTSASSESDDGDSQYASAYEKDCDDAIAEV